MCCAVQYEYVYNSVELQSMKQNDSLSVQEKISRKTFLQYLFVSLGAVAAISPLAFFWGQSQSGTRNTPGYGELPYGGARK
jgi:hypothetical protein